MALNTIRRMESILFYKRRIKEFNLLNLPKLRLGGDIVTLQRHWGSKHWGDRKMLS